MRKITKLKSVVMAVVIAASMMSGCTNVTVNVNTGDSKDLGTEETSEVVTESSESAADGESDDNQEQSDVSTGDITIVYTNDVHSYIDNVIKDKDGNVTGDGLRFSKVAAMVNDMKSEGRDVILVDAGDQIQGDIYGAMDEGETIIQIMNATGYDLATPGNHDFDYGVISFLKLVEEANFPYVSCNFHSTQTKDIVFPSSKIYDLAGKKVAFIGITTPDTITASTPVYFQNEKGEFIYTVDGSGDAKDLYVSVQSAIDNVKDKVDYTIALGHVGVGMDSKSAGISSEDIIQNTTGLDAFIDGHSHTTMEGKLIKDKAGKDVMLTQTGSYFNACGVMTISQDGKISTKLVEDYEREDEKVAQIETQWIQDINDRMSEKIAELSTTLYINNPDDDNQRLIRAKELNMGDFTADSIYWFFNDRLELDCDIVLNNGGGIRAQIEKGNITYFSAKQVEPYGNMICLISATGQQIVDALEMGSSVIGVWDDEWNAPEENGGFMQVAGLSYTIDGSVPSSIKTDENGMFVSVDGDYRVKDVSVYNKETGKYEPIDLQKTYEVGGINYILRNGGNGLSMFMDDELTVDYVGQDYVILAEYMKSFATDGEYAKISTDNSPLKNYNGYLLDYENPYGAGRINIVNIDE